MERPELDISALIYDDEATVKRKQREYEQDMEFYIKQKIADKKNKKETFEQILIIAISIITIISFFLGGYDRGYDDGRRAGRNEAYDNDDIITDNKRSKSNTAETESWQKGLSVYITNSGIKYHRAWCNSLSNSKIGVTLAEAISQGYEPCDICKPPPEMP